MPLSDIVRVVISAQVTNPTRASFGISLISSYHTIFAERVRQYSSVTAMLTDGFTASDPAVLAATAISSQNPRPTHWLVGRELNTEEKKMKVTPRIARASTVYSLVIAGTTRSYTSDATPTIAEITAGLDAAVDPVAWAPTTAYTVGQYVANDTGPIKNYVCVTAGTSAGSGGPTGTGSGITDGSVVWNYVGPDLAITVTDNGTDLDIEASTVADWFTLYAANPILIGLNDITPDGSPSGIVADIVDMQLENDTWYGLVLGHQGKAIITAAAAYIETLRKLMVVATPDVDCLSTSTSDIMSTLQTASYARTALLYHPKAGVQYPGAAWQGLAFPKDPGSLTWNVKTLAGVDAVILTETEQTNIRNKDGNYYVTIGGVNITQDGRTSAGEFIDVTRTIDWTAARMQENVFTLLANADKIPFTDAGIAAVQKEVQAVLDEGVGNGAYAADPAPTVLVPKAAAVSTANKLNRLLPDVSFTATLAGAIHEVEIDGVVSV